MKIPTTIICAFLVSLISACDNRPVNQGSAGSVENLRSAPPPGLPQDYFPVDIGRTWSYTITLYEDVDALNHSVVEWPMGDRAILQEIRGRFYTTDSMTKPYRLVLKVKAPAAKQGNLSYPEGYELEIERDDLGVFGRDCTGLFWAITKSIRYEVSIIILHDPRRSPEMSSNPWGSSYGEPGICHRLFFFGEEPGIQIGLSGHNDALLFLGPTQFQGKSALRFVRTVDGRNDRGGETTILDKGFTEEMYFVKGVGLAQLTQKVDGVTTMTWHLD